MLRVRGEIPAKREVGLGGRREIVGVVGFIVGGGVSGNERRGGRGGGRAYVKGEIGRRRG